MKAQGREEAIDERRRDNAGLTLQLRVFDALGSAKGMLAKDDLIALLGLDEIVIGNAVQRLRRLKCLCSICVDGEWRYGLRPGAERPVDRRGGTRQTQQQAMTA